MIFLLLEQIVPIDFRFKDSVVQSELQGDALYKVLLLQIKLNVES